MSKDLIFNMYEHLKNLVNSDSLEKATTKAWSSTKESKERLDENVKFHVKHTLGLNEADQPNVGNIEIPKIDQKEVVNKVISKQGAGVATKPKEGKNSQKINDVNKIGDTTDKVGINKFSKDKSINKATHTISKAKQDGLGKGYKPLKMKENKVNESLEFADNQDEIDNSQDGATVARMWSTSNESRLKEDFNNGGVPSSAPTNPSNKGKETVLGTFSDEKVAKDTARDKKGEVAYDEKQKVWKVTVKESVEVIICQDGEPKAILDIGNDGSVVGHALVKEESEEPVETEEIADEPKEEAEEYGVDESKLNERGTHTVTWFKDKIAKLKSQEKTQEIEAEIKDLEKQAKDLENYEKENGLRESKINEASYHRQAYQEIAEILTHISDKSIKIDLIQRFIHIFKRDNPLFNEEKFQEAILNGVSESKKVEIEKIIESGDDFTIAYAECLTKSLKDTLGVSIEGTKVISKLKSLERPELELLKDAMVQQDVQALRHFLNSIIGPKETEALIEQ